MVMCVRVVWSTMALFSGSTGVFQSLRMPFTDSPCGGMLVKRVFAVDYFVFEAGDYALSFDQNPHFYLIGAGDEFVGHLSSFLEVGE